MEYLIGFFDGAAQRNTCGCGFWISISNKLAYKTHWYGGSGTNTKAEAMALWGLLCFTNFLGIPAIHIYGDSKIIIDQIMGRANINNPLLLGWLGRIGLLWNQLNNSTIMHIGREQNKEVDEILKRGLLGNFGNMHMEIILNQNVLDVRDFPFPG